MLAARVTCPSCGTTLTVSENAPPRVTCPRCLAMVVNPASLESVGPRPVLPLDDQVARDAKVSTAAVIALLAVMGTALFVSYSAGDLRAFRFVLLLTLAIVVCLFFLGGLWLPGRRAAQPAWEPPVDETPPAPGQPIALNYSVPRRPSGPPVTAGAIAAGFFTAILVCGLGFLVLAASAFGGPARTGDPNYNAFILAAVVTMVIGFIVFAVRFSGRWRGFGPGATAGLVLGLMALGPCAACYLLTLGN